MNMLPPTNPVKRIVAPHRVIRNLWISHPVATGQVGVDAQEIIRSTPPCWRTFLGQPLGNLTKWLAKLGPGLKTEVMTPWDGGPGTS